MDEKYFLEKDVFYKIHKKLNAAVKLPVVGNELYHFTSINALKSIVESNSLRLTNCMYLNDLLEHKDFAKSMIEVLNKENNIETDLKNKLVKNYENILNCEREDYSMLNYFIFSTCLNNNNSSMWSYYSKIDGVCIEFNKEANKLCER